jgi:hypothetical protein
MMSATCANSGTTVPVPRVVRATRLLTLPLTDRGHARGSREHDGRTRPGSQRPLAAPRVFRADSYAAGMARTCVFCGGSPTTREHLWPDWARRMLAEAGALPHRQVLDRQGQERVDREWRQQAYSWTVRAVCAKCNNGWMSLIESRAQRLFEPMLHGRGRALHEGSQRTLAAWALKTALIFEQAQNPGRRVVPEGEYHYLHEYGQPSPDVRIWMASYAGDMPGYAHMYGADADITQGDERGVRDIYGSTVAFGPVVFQLFGTTVLGLVDGMRVGSAPAVHQLWPYEGSFTWAPRPGFDDAALLAFSESILAELVRLVGGPEHAA